MKTLWVMVGIPGAGKSTWILNHRKYFKGNEIVISRDEIRYSLIDNKEGYFSKESEVWFIFINKIKEALKENEAEVIVDATHLNSRSRTRLLRCLNDSLKNVEVNAIVINTDLEIALKRNSKRIGLERVPEDTIRDMKNRMTIPTLEEGFDNIYLYTEKNGKIKYQIIGKGDV